MLDYHRATNHSLESVRADRHTLDWPNQPVPFKIYTSLDPIPLPLTFTVSGTTGQPSTHGAELSEGEASMGSTTERRPANGQPADGEPHQRERTVGRPTEGESPGGLSFERNRLDRNLVARLCYFANGVTKVLRGMPFRAAACTGALYHIELYVVCGDLEDLPGGVYHYGAQDNALRQLRAGDFRFNDAPITIVLTSTWWRNAWKYQSRAYRHAFWDTGTVLANLLSVAEGQRQPAEVLAAFPDHELNSLLDVNPSHEAAIALVTIGHGSGAPAGPPPYGPLTLPTQRLSAREVEYPLILQAHAESSLPSWDATRAWRTHFPSPKAESWTIPNIEEVILRRGSSRRFSDDPISNGQLHALIRAATSPTPMDAFVPCDLYLIANAIEDFPSGTYVVDRRTSEPRLLKRGDFRREAAYLDLGQSLAGDAALNAYWLVDLHTLDDRGYRAAQLSAAIEAGKLYLAAYAQHLGATGLTFFDDDVTEFFSPHAAGKSVMFLTAVGHPARRSGS